MGRGLMIMRRSLSGFCLKGRKYKYHSSSVFRLNDSNNI